MPTRIRQLPPDEISALTLSSFTLAPIHNRLPHYAGPTGALFLAETDGHPSACAAITYQPAAPHQPTLHIDHFVVLPTFRGHGLGGRLMKVLLDHAKSLNIPTITANIPGWCPDWRAFYSRFGFVFTNPENSHTDQTPVQLHLDV